MTVSEFLAESKRIEEALPNEVWDEEVADWIESALPRMRGALETLMSWAERDLERAQPKYGAYAEGLVVAQQIVREFIESALAENGGTDD
jgi:hypothetical protein